MPRLAANQDAIVDRVSAELGLPLEVGSLEGSWQGLSPVLMLKHVSLQNPDGDMVFNAGHVRVSIDLWRSLFFRTLVANTVVVVNTRLLLSESPSGRWGLHRLPLGEGGFQAGVLLGAFVDRINVLELGQIQATVVINGESVPMVDSGSLVLRRGLYLSQLTAELNSSAHSSDGPRVRLQGEFVGRVFDATMVRGYLQLNGAELAPFAPLLQNAEFGLSGQASGEFWFNWRAARAWEVQGSVAVRQWNISSLIGRDVPPVDSLSMSAVLEGSPQGHLEGRIVDAGLRWNAADLQLDRVRFSLAPRSRKLQLAVGSMDLGAAMQVAEGSGLLPARLAAELDILKPRGQLRNIHLALPLRSGGAPELDLSSRLVGVSLSPWRAAPAVSSLDGVISLGSQWGELELDGGDVTLQFPHFLGEPQPFSAMSGRFSWTLDEVLKVRSSLLQARGDFGEGVARLALEVPLQRSESHPPSLTFEVGVPRSEAGHRRRFIPALLPEGLRDWLDVSIQGGELHQVGFIYHGSLRKQQPMAKRVQLFLDVRDGRLNYLPDWPLLEAVDAHVLLSDDRLDASIERGELLDSQLTGVQLQVLPDRGDYPLAIHGELQGPAADILTLLSDSPLSSFSGGGAQGWRASGAYQAKLELGVPLRAGLSPDISIDGRLQGVDVEYPGLDFTLARVSGAISYDSDRGLSARALRARLWGEPIRISIATGSTAASDGIRAVQLRALAPIDVQDIQRWAGQPALALASGRSDWYATLTIPVSGGKRKADFQLESDLDGVSLDLPQPFGKTEAEKRKLGVQIAVGANGVEGEVSYQRLLQARISSAGRRFRAGIWLGRDGTPSLPASGVSIAGNLDQVVVSDWLHTARRYRALQAGGGGGRAMPAVSIRELGVRRFDVFGHQLQDATLALGNAGQHWQLSLQHADLAGTVTLPDGEAPYQFDIDRLVLPPGGSAADNRRSLLHQVNPGTFPHAQVRIASLSIGDQDLGRWSFTIKPQGDALEVSALDVALEGASFAGVEHRAAGARLTWKMRGEQHSSALRGKFRGENLDELLSGFGYDSGIVSDSVDVMVDLIWDGTPNQIELTTVSGDLILRLEDGQLRQTSGTPAEALRVLGILNVNSLARRLRLDFSDLYKSGLSYDRISGAMRLDRGRLYLQQPLIVEGPSSQLTLRGDFDLVDDVIDTELVVLLPLTSNLPWVMALALPGGLPVAAGVFVAGQVFQKQLDSLTSAVYHISGELDDPDVEFKHLADTSQSASSPGSRARRERTGARR